MVFYLLGALLLVSVDRILKVFMTSYLAGGVKPLIPGFIQFHYTENTGAAFGSFESMTLALTILTSILILVLLYVIVSKLFKSKLANIALMLITAGGIGNLYDRIFNGYVVDYLEFTFVNYAIFNFADILITFGAVLLVIFFIFFDKTFFRSDKKENKAALFEEDNTNASEVESGRDE